jgi:pimeloyl-ACP methyl ester carboxylesterase
MIQTESAIAPAIVSNEEIRPFKINKVPQAELDELKRRIAATRWPEKETVNDQSQGVPLATMKAFAHYWATDYDWRKVEAKLNALPHFITEIDGLDIHFIHVRSKHTNALPLIVTHGWPGSIIEQLKIIGPLTDPTAYDGRAEDAFDIVIPSIPGYGYSEKPASTGWDPSHVARAWAVLMKRLGYTKYVAQGGDWGALITEQLGVLASPELLAININLPSVVPAEIFNALAGHMPPPGISAEEKYAFERLDFFLTQGLAYAGMMASRPQTHGYGVTDSPVGLASFFLDKFNEWTDSGGHAEKALTRDEMLDDITLYWLTNTAASSAQLYWENKLAFFAPMGVKIPVAVSVFPSEVYQAPRSWAERAYPKLIHYNKLEKGGHFAAWEQPKFLAEEIRVSFRSFRK